MSFSELSIGLPRPNWELAEKLRFMWLVKERELRIHKPQADRSFNQQRSAEGVMKMVETDGLSWEAKEVLQKIKSFNRLNRPGFAGGSNS
ncbi:MAG: hypothetical protein WBF43_04150 [Methylocella sp.]